MISELITFIDLILDYGLWGLFVVFILVIGWLMWILIDVDRSSTWRSKYYWVKYKLFGDSDAEKKFIENHVNSRINLARRAMPFGNEYLPKAIKINWFEGGAGQATSIENNEIIVRLDPAELQERNVVLLTTALVEKTALVGIRHILDEPLERSIDMNLIKSLIEEIGDKRILDWYLRNEYQPNITKSTDIKKWNEKIVEINDRGLFTRMLLVELDEYSRKTAGKPYSREMSAEISGLINFLYKITTASSQKPPLDYITRNIKIGVILVGKTSKILSDINRYLIAFAYKMDRQLTSVYVLVWDKEVLGKVDPQAYEEFVERTESLDERIQTTFKVKKDFEIKKYEFIDSQGNKRTGKITHYSPRYEGNKIVEVHPHGY
ncbi:MAG: hypothetical protein JW878_07755 [Methanomicrobia archaeon]|nr:hypothetical protein [Methanomicrobia archaeon]